MPPKRTCTDIGADIASKDLPTDAFGSRVRLSAANYRGIARFRKEEARRGRVRSDNAERSRRYTVRVHAFDLVRVPDRSSRGAVLSRATRVRPIPIETPSDVRVRNRCSIQRPTARFFMSPLASDVAQWANLPKSPVIRFLRCGLTENAIRLDNITLPIYIYICVVKSLFKYCYRRVIYVDFSICIFQRYAITRTFKYYVWVAYVGAISIDYRRHRRTRTIVTFVTRHLVRARCARKALARTSGSPRPSIAPTLPLDFNVYRITQFLTIVFFFFLLFISLLNSSCTA